MRRGGEGGGGGTADGGGEGVEGVVMTAEGRGGGRWQEVIGKDVGKNGQRPYIRETMHSALNL